MNVFFVSRLDIENSKLLFSKIVPHAVAQWVRANRIPERNIERFLKLSKGRFTEKDLRAALDDQN